MKTRIPSDTEMPDRVLAGLTMRQLAIVATTSVVVWALYIGLGRRLPLPAFVALAAPFAALGLTGLVSRTPIEQILIFALRHLTTAPRRVVAPDGLSLPMRSGTGPRTRLGVVDFPVHDVRREGVLDLGDEGVSMICRASGLNFELRSEDEQCALVQGFGRLLNSFDAPVQFLVTSEQQGLGEMIASLEEAAHVLTYPGLSSLALDHAAFLRSLADVGGRSRCVFICVRDPVRRDAGIQLAHTIEQFASQLRGIGIRRDRLDGPVVARILRDAGGPQSLLPAGVALPGEPVRGKERG